MASRLINIFAILASIGSILTEPPVRLSERHLRAIPENQLQYQQQEDVDNGWQDSVPGLPGRDYPNLTTIPETSFTCAGKTPGGYYADVETRCQVFHVCSTQGSKSSFLCPSGSIFNQRHFVCDWWYDFVCEHALELYSLNDALNDPESSTDQPKDDRHRYNQLPIAPVQFNSIAGSNGDLSLASSGYTNNLRDEANLIYEDSANRKSAADSKQAFGNVDNYSSDGRQKDPGRLYEQQTSYYVGNYEPSATTTTPMTISTATHRTRIPNQDIVPRGFSKQYEDEQIFVENRDLRKNNQGPGIFVNNGLSDSSVKRNRNSNQDVFSRENNFVDNNSYRKYNENDNRIYNNNNFNDNYNENYNRNYNTNYSNYNSINNSKNIYENNYQNTENSIFAQENNNYVSNNFEKNDVNNYEQSSENNYYNTIRIYSSEKYHNVKNEESTSRSKNVNSYNNIYNTKNPDNINNYNNVNSNNNNYDNRNDNSNNKHQENYYPQETSEYTTVGNFDFPEDHFEHSFEATTVSPRSITTSPLEDEVDRERQREVDSVDLKRQRIQYDYPFLIREESSYNSWRDDLSTSGTGSRSPPYPPERSYSNSESPSQPLPKAEEPTTLEPATTAKLRPKFLGRRPPGGLPSGAGNGLPGAKNLVASNAITGRPNREGFNSAGNGNYNNVAGENDGWSYRDNHVPPQMFEKGNTGGSNGNYGYAADGEYRNNNHEQLNDGSLF